MRIEAVHPKELGVGEEAAWRAMAQADPALSSPYYAFGWAKAVGAARADARIAVIEDGGAIQGFLGVQGRDRFAALALGAPLSDYQGLISADPHLPVEASALCQAVRAGRIDFTHIGAGVHLLAGGVRGEALSFIADVRDGRAAYLAALSARRKETVRQQDRKWRTFQKAHPEVRMVLPSADRAHLDRLLQWKTDHCRRTGQPLVWGAPWVRQVVEQAFASQDPAFSGKLFTIVEGEKLVAANFFLASADTLHDWIIGHDPAFDKYSPGVTLTRSVVEWAAEAGFREVDLGVGTYRYKRELTLDTRPVGFGYVAGRTSLSGAFRGAQYRVRQALEAAAKGKVAEAPGKLMRRLEVQRGLSAG